MSEVKDDELDGRLAYRPSEAAAIIGVSRSRLYELMSAGDVPARKLGARTLVLRSDLVRYLESLPAYEAM